MLRNNLYDDEYYVFPPSNEDLRDWLECLQRIVDKEKIGCVCFVELKRKLYGKYGIRINDDEVFIKVYLEK